MRYVLLVVGGLMALMGAVWMLQGVGVLPGSFMTGQAFWAVMGVFMLVCRRNPRVRRVSPGQAPLIAAWRYFRSPGSGRRVPLGVLHRGMKSSSPAPAVG